MFLFCEQKIDFAAAGFSVTASRQSVIDFVSPYYSDESVVIIHRPLDDNKVLLFAQPFRYCNYTSLPIK